MSTFPEPSPFPAGGDSPSASADVPTGANPWGIQSEGLREESLVPQAGIYPTLFSAPVMKSVSQMRPYFQEIGDQVLHDHHDIVRHAINGPWTLAVYNEYLKTVWYRCCQHGPGNRWMPLLPARLTCPCATHLKARLHCRNVCSTDCWKVLWCLGQTASTSVLTLSC